MKLLFFHLINGPNLPVILGYTWLLRHNPHIDWAIIPLYSGVSIVILFVSDLLCPLLPFTLSPLSFPTSLRFLRNTWTSRQCSARPGPSCFLVHMTVALTSSLVLSPPRAGYSPFLPPRLRRWKNTSKRHWLVASFDPLYSLLEQASFSWRRRIRPSGPELTNVASVISQLKTGTTHLFCD